MSLTATQTSTINLSGPRKRTSSFCYSQLAANPRPAKAPRLSKSMGSTLRRTETYIDLSNVASTSSKKTSTSRTASKAVSEHTANVPYCPIQLYRDQRDKERRKNSMNPAVEPLNFRLSPQLMTRPTTTASLPAPQLPDTGSSTTTTALALLNSRLSTSQRAALSIIKSPTPVPATSTVPSSQRQTSPLSPAQEPRPSRPQFPRSKPEPDLYKKALRTCMKSTPEGQKILRMGARLAISIMTATRELERIVAAQELREKEVADDAMAVDSQPVLSKSWVVIADQDWEMVDCSA